MVRPRYAIWVVFLSAILSYPSQSFQVSPPHPAPAVDVLEELMSETVTFVELKRST
jgi:hypothetical protein